MAADRQRLAQALAAEAARRRLFESIPELPGQGLPQAPEVTNYGRDLENLSIGLGRGAVNQLEGLKGLVTSPVESVKGIVSGVGEVIRNPRMIAEALQRTGERAASGPLGLGEVVGENFNMARVPSAKPVMSEINVYHGSPHKFEAFDASKIGTGEGAQAYGHGIYLAESPDVAKTYKAANDPIARKAEELLRSTDGDVDRAMRYAKKKVEDLEKNRDVKGFFSPVALEQNQGALNYLQQMKKGKPPQIGSMYTADLPDPMVERMLDWDASIKSQPESIRNALQPLLDKHGIARTADIGTLISAMGRDMPQSMVSEKLRQLGIPGIKYKDAGSRGQGGTGTRNFVVFPGEETKVKILKRE